MSENNETNAEQVAKEYGIKISKPKEVPVSTDDNMIASPGTSKKGGKKSGALRPNAKGVIASGKADLSPKPKPAAKSETKKPVKVALFSTKNVNWPGVGEIGKGYNIVTRAVADKWLTRDHVREATPEEVAESFEG